jgi:hypothetical protein
MDHFPRPVGPRGMIHRHLQSRWDNPICFADGVWWKPDLQSRKGLLETRSAKQIGLNGNWNKKV